jgi:crotonobetainyl-CoA:carnitine CoA-transferase CaiB-like acyl-CoA transferase
MHPKQIEARPEESMLPTHSAALEHVKIVDLTRILAGPWATQTLADLGADVIKIESPAGGDDTRHWGPPFTGPDPADASHDAAYFYTANRNKKSVAIDFSTDKGAELVRHLVAQSDVFIENFKVGGLKQYGLDYDTLKQLKPDLIYCSITGFGQTGPYAKRAGYDFIIQAMSGLMSVTGQAPGTPGDEPMKIGVALTDVLTGLYSCIGILSALSHRDRTGEGQHIDMSLLDVSVAAMANQSLNYLVSGNSPIRMGNAHPNIVPYQVFPTSDGHLIMTAGNERQFRSLCKVLGEESLADDERYQSNQLRVANRESIIEKLSQLSAMQTTAQLIEALGDAKVPCGPINDMASVFNDPHVIARELQIDVPKDSGHAGDNDTAGDGQFAPGVACPVRLSETPPAYRHAPPVLGQHTLDVLQQQLGLTSDQASELVKAGVCHTSGNSQS